MTVASMDHLVSLDLREREETVVEMVPMARRENVDHKVLTVSKDKREIKVQLACPALMVRREIKEVLVSEVSMAHLAHLHQKVEVLREIWDQRETRVAVVSRENVDQLRKEMALDPKETRDSLAHVVHRDQGVQTEMWDHSVTWECKDPLDHVDLLDKRESQVKRDPRDPKESLQMCSVRKEQRESVVLPDPTDHPDPQDLKDLEEYLDRLVNVDLKVSQVSVALMV